MAECRKSERLLDFSVSRNQNEYKTKMSTEKLGDSVVVNQNIQYSGFPTTIVKS